MRLPYPSYKPSGVEWLGDVPEHWEVGHLRRFTSYIQTGSTPSAAQWEELAGDEISWFSPSDIGSNLQIKQSSKTLSSKAIYDRLVPIFPEASTLIVGIGLVGRVGHNAQASTGNQQITCIKGNEYVFPSFLSWYLWAISYSIRCTAPHTLLPIANNEFLLSFILLVPPLEEQRAIAEFLDRETARVDALVEKKQQLIERLAEYRTALIIQTVTKGLPPDVAAAEEFNPASSFKPSGVEWLGDVPEHWKVKRLHRICQLAYGDSLPADSRQTGDFPVLGSNGAVGYHKETNTLAPVIVIGRKGSHGKVNFNNGPIFAIDTTFFIDRRSTDAELRWLYFSLLCIELDEESMDSAVPGLSRQYAYEKYLVLPPLQEQRAIAEFLDRETERIDALSARVESAIERLQEYRMALITAAVTGKIDVRGFVGVETADIGTVAK